MYKHVEQLFAVLKVMRKSDFLIWALLYLLIMDAILLVNMYRAALQLQ